MDFFSPYKSQNAFTAKGIIGNMGEEGGNILPAKGIAQFGIKPMFVKPASGVNEYSHSHHTAGAEAAVGTSCRVLCSQI